MSECFFWSTLPVFIQVYAHFLGFSGGSDGKESTCSAGDLGSIPESGRFPWRRAWQLTLVFLPGESHGCLTVLKFRSLKSRHLQGCFLPRAIRKGSASVLLSWLVCVHLFPYLFTLLSLYACLLLCQIFCFYKEPVIWIRAILVTSF